MSTVKRNKTKTFAYYIKIKSFFSPKYENENKTETFLASFYLFKVNNRNNRTMNFLKVKIIKKFNLQKNIFIIFRINNYVICAPFFMYIWELGIIWERGNYF